MRITSQKGFSGIDERVQLQDSPRFASAIRDFRITNSGSLQKRPDKVLCHTSVNGAIKAVWRGMLGGSDVLLLVCGNALYRANPAAEPFEASYVGAIGSGECTIFPFGDYVYIKSESCYSKYNGSNFSAVEGYIPCVAINCSPNGEGELLENINLITDKRRIKYSCNGTNVAYVIPEDGALGISGIKLNGESYSGEYAFIEATRTVSFKAPPPAGISNLEICYYVSPCAENKQRILGCRNSMLFGGNSDGRVFLWGNPDYPDHRFCSELAEGVPGAEYFPVNNYTVIGNTEITCMVQQYDRQLIFTRDKAYYSYCELREDALGNVYSSFPVFSLNGTKGCLFRTPGCVIDNRPVTLCADGLNIWESTSIENEKNAICISKEIAGSVRSFSNSALNNLKMFDFQANSELYLVNGSVAYVYNYSNGCWYIFNDFTCDSFFVYGSELYLSSGTTLYRFGNSSGFGENRTDLWLSSFITAGTGKGNADIVGLELDAFIQGPVTLGVEIEESGGGRSVARSFEFPFTESRYRRISLRPALKRVMPFRIKLTESGNGNCVFHNISIITKEKERSNRFGIH